jgi:hypothetical protein
MAARRRKGRKTARRRKVKRGAVRRARAGRTKAAGPKRKRTPARRAAPRPKAKPRPPRPRAAAPKPRPAAEARPRGGAPLVAGAPIEVGVVLHYYARPGAGVVALSRPIHRGDTIHVRGQTTDFVQTVEELALDGASVAEGAPPQQIGVRLAQRARAGDRVYRVSW